MFISRVRSEANDRSPFGRFWFEPIGLLTRSGARVTPSTAMTLPAVLACVRVLAESFAVLPFMLFQPRARGRGPQVRNHWLYRLLAKAPNRFQSPYEFRLMLMGHLALRGNAFCQIAANSRGEITELLPLHPDRMSIEPLSNGSYRYVYLSEDGRTLPFARHEIWHLRGMSDDGYMGLSMIQLAREAIGEGLAMQSYASRFFSNDAKPGGGWIEYPGSFATNEAKKKFRDSWQENQGGANRGKVAVLEKGMKFHELGVKHSDAQFLESRGAKRSEIASIFRVPPHKIMDLERSTNNNIEHQGIEFWNDTMLPWIRLWESSISFFLLGEESDLEPCFDHTVMMLGDGKSRAERLARLVLSGILLRNEAREEEGYDPIDGLDEPMQPANMMTLEQAEKQEQQRPSQPAGPVDDTGARLARVLQGNAARMARRLKAGKSVDAAVLAEALGISEERAAAWSPDPSDTEEQLTAALISLGVPA
ncbi:MAG TPA: phage portal protein [Noviherbaspirillum sp.]|nr:phage portal protein [Noviherbaspirillum sp.]